MAKKFIDEAIKHPGALRRSMGAKKGEPIPAEKLKAAARSNGKTGKRARLAITLRDLSKDKPKEAEPPPAAQPVPMTKREEPRKQSRAAFHRSAMKKTY